MSRAPTREFDRSERIGAELLRELTRILQRGVKDPRLGDITLQEVRVSRDLAHAKVFFTCFPLDSDHAAQARLLNGPLAGFLRHELSRGTRLRTMPELRFVHDESILRGERLAALIEQANQPMATTAAADSASGAAAVPPELASQSDPAPEPVPEPGRQP
ncbi:MAG: 30S ribosome-binding factor RbfA [Chromatiaceae bacterium]|nr:MAG: 30S ribosome-binding factor RbfA [Chromatiaceae bacterium]